MAKLSHWNVVKMEREDVEWRGFRMVQAENGAWEVGFMPIQ